MDKQEVGTLFVLISAISFGFTPIFARLAYSQGINVDELLFFRFLIGFIITGIVLACRRRLSLPRMGDVSALIVLGGFGYFLETTLYFTSLLYTSVAVTALLLYMYPAFVTMGAFALGWEKLSRHLSIVIAVALLGLLLVANPFGDSFGIGVTLGLGASIMYSAFILGSSRVLRRVSGDVGAFYVMGAASLSFGLTGEATGSFRVDWGLWGWLWILLISLVCTVVAVITFFMGIRRIGPSRSALISLVEPVTSVLIALGVFGNALTAPQWFGGLLILASAAATALHSRKAQTRDAPVSD
jgi:drug/metabolite transporter (DMT)-like permease